MSIQFTVCLRLFDGCEAWPSFMLYHKHRHVARGLVRIQPVPV
jgi:hypothetical protein